MRLLPLLLIPVLAISLSGCADTAGPLQLEAGHGSCGDSALYKDLVFGIGIKNAGPHPIEITSLTFDSSAHVRVNGAWVVPDYVKGSVTQSVGTEKYPLTSPAWADRETIPGALVPPNTESNIAVHLALSSGARAGTAVDATVKYTDADRQTYVATSPVTFGFGPSANCG